ncbi:MAG: PhzF family phenazine biosynthesis protein [Burkholderiales bacterium]
MRTVRFKQVDVFTRVPFRGNPVAVVLQGEGLATDEMQRIAGWTNLSETTFVLPASSAAADYRLRIFTPRAELPFAGHPTIGSAHAVLEAGIAEAKHGRLRQECGVGILELQVEADTLWLDSPAATDTRVDDADLLVLKRLLGKDIKHFPLIVNVGPRWLVAELVDAGAVAALAPDMQAMVDLSNRLAIGGVTVYGAADDGVAAIHVRPFAPAHGIAEDPVCGSGNIGVAAYLRKAGRLGDGYIARQGMQLGRDGQVSIRFHGDRILLGGNAVTCVDGTLRV